MSECDYEYVQIHEKTFIIIATPASSPAKTQNSGIALPGTVSKTVSSNVIARNSSSPNRSPKLARAAAAVVAGNTEMKDYGPIDVHQMENYPPHAFNSSNNVSKASSLVKPMMGGSSNNVSGVSQSRIPNPSSGHAQLQSKISSASSSPSKMPQPFSATRSKSNLTSASGIGLRKIPAATSGISSPKSLTSSSKIPPPSNTSNQSGRLSSVQQSTCQQPLPQGCSVKPLPKHEPSLTASGASNNTENVSVPSSIQNSDSAQHSQPTTSENDEATAMMTASFHSRTCSLPRQKRLGREDGSPGPPCANVAVVSPMPTTKSPKISKIKVSEDKLPNGENRGPQPKNSNEGKESLTSFVSNMSIQIFFKLQLLHSYEKIFLCSLGPSPNKNLNGNETARSDEALDKEDVPISENEIEQKNNLVRKLSQDTSSDDPLNNIVPMAPLGMYGTIADQTTALPTGTGASSVNGNMGSHPSKEIIQEGTKESSIINGMKQQHHLPFSSRPNGVNCGTERNGVGNATFNQQPHHQDLVAYNTSIASMTPQHINSGKTQSDFNNHQKILSH